MKSEATSIYEQLGIGISTAIRIFIKCLVEEKGVLFSMRLSNWKNGKAAVAAMHRMNETTEKNETAEKKMKENMRFRTFLKCNADEKELDEQFLRLHNELFKNYDCSRCRNCCKMYYGCIPEKDIQKDADHLGVSEDEFITTYLEPKKEEWEDKYNTLHMPCDFLHDDGECVLGECRPDSCKKYPYTNQPERLESLYSVLDAVEVCPVAFEIYERLKMEYGFR